jgi:hypothetical protein
MNVYRIHSNAPSLNSDINNSSILSFFLCNLTKRLIVSVFVSLAVLGFECRSLQFLGRNSTAWAVPPVFFVLVILIRSHFFPRPVWSMIFLFYTSQHHWDDRHEPPHPAFYCWDAGSYKHFYQGWPWTMILQILASQTARITGVSYQCQAHWF